MSQLEGLEKLYDEAYRAAAIHSKNPTDESAELLYSLCERLGKNPEELISKVASDPYNNIVAASRVDRESKRGRCKQFVMDFTRDKDEVSAMNVLDAGTKHGFTPNMMREEAKKIGLITYKKDYHFYWRRSPLSRLASATVSED